MLISVSPIDDSGHSLAHIKREQKVFPLDIWKSSIQETKSATDDEYRAGLVPKQRNPWLTFISITAMLFVFLRIEAKRQFDEKVAVAQWGAVGGNEVWNGNYLGLLAPALVHLELWHLALNVLWIWVLGSRLERQIGSDRWLLFVVPVEFVSSAWELGASGDPGIGASGVVYAIFGFMWVTRSRYSLFREVLSNRLVLFFLIWLVGCWIVTLRGWFLIANFAHFAGMCFGLCVGAISIQYRRWISYLALAILAGCPVLFLFWCPWQIHWLGHKAYTAHVRHDLDRALALYSQIIKRDPTNDWAYANRSAVFAALGRNKEAADDWEQAVRLNPQLERNKP